MCVENFKLPAFTPEPPKLPESPTLDPAPRQYVHGGGRASLAQLTEAEGLPASVHTEITTLGAMMLEAEACQYAAAKLTPEDFSLDSHSRIFKVIVHLHRNGGGIDYRLVRAELDRRKETDAIGGPAYLAFLTEGVPRNINIESYVRIVKDKSLLRQLMSMFQYAGTRASDQSEDAIGLFRDIEERMAELANSGLRLRKDRSVLIGAQEFIRDTQPNVEWTVDGLIQKGGNGLIVGDPGTAKSYSALDLAYHLVAGVAWLGRDIPERKKVAFVAREDHPGLTQHRALSLLRGYAGGELDRGLSDIELNEWLYYNTRAQMETFSLQKEDDVLEIIDAFKEKGIEIAFFDVFRRLWEGDENDNREVAKVLATLTRIQSECGCSVVLIHHLNKGDGGTIFQRIRGAGSIYGWREWAFGISIENPEDDPKDRIRKMVFETKAATPASPIYYCFDGDADKVSIATCAAPVRDYKKSSKKEQNSGPIQEAIPWYQE